MDLGLSCEASYSPEFITQGEANSLFDHLTETLDFTNHTFKLGTGEVVSVNFGKHMFMDQSLFDEDKLPAQVWGKTSVWSDQVRLIKEKVELFTGHQFQVCVCIYYPDGTSGVGFHSDFVAFGDTNYIPSLSLGEEREFVLRNKLNGKETSIELANGSLVTMGNKCQELYEHALPENPKYKNARINLTFRKYGN
ncbi:alpha-ketoglutarate-dependent dioxygenase AlkB [Algoriphagus machipongonensis]|uniref:DNA repair protein n=1 Tax=Algoriphagus machipongonensis TaxID=388413 RepID=A3HTM7_9BACT|nr:alpha-ketoglutarate-dependent dioxygenase AlkB [Algoriphagus machipongonensis]EAZ83195.1 DNA repair protein [Algoriphagus machipongonensis]